LSLIIYHGTENPEPKWAGALVDHIVVLQPYHPIVQTEEFAKWFPGVDRHVYVNPTSVDLERCQVSTDLVFYDPQDRWQLPRLRIPEGLEFALDDAKRLAGLEGVDGLFVDDVDLLERTNRSAALNYLWSVSEGGTVPLSINRGFALLDDLPAVTAILLENQDHDAIHDYGRAMLQAYAPHVARAAKRGAQVHRLEYGPAPDQDRVPREMATAAHTNSRLPHESLSSWDYWYDCLQSTDWQITISSNIEKNE